METEVPKIGPFEAIAEIRKAHLEMTIVACTIIEPEQIASAAGGDRLCDGRLVSQAFDRT